MPQREAVAVVVLALAGGAAVLAATVSSFRRRRRAGAKPRLFAGRYRLEAELGRGAMGTVHLAHDVERGGPVAVKTLRLPAAREDAVDVRARFLREAEAARRLRHPDIVAVVDAGEARGVAFIVMELVPGTDLAAHVGAGTLLPTKTVLETVARVALALDHAHRLGVVHRDVKPANVMLDLPTGAVKVTDFGLAHLADAERTRTGVLLGTPVYMSPEQLAGSRIDGRSDLYSLGVVLYQMLTGALPYRETPMSELLRQIASAPAPDPRDRRPDLPAALADVVALALQKPPGLRYADGRAFAADLREIARRMGGGDDTGKS